MALADIDRQLIERCLAEEPQAWEDFVDRFLGLMVHVVNHTAKSRAVRLTNSDQEDLISEVFLAILDNDFAVLRRFRGRSSLATYLAVVARRVVVRKVLSSMSGLSSATHQAYAGQQAVAHEPLVQRIDDADQIQQLLNRLDGPEAQVVRLFHLEGKSYQEISTATGMPENSIGPALSRARQKMRQDAPPQSVAPAPPPADTDTDITPTAGQPAG